MKKALIFLGLLFTFSISLQAQSQNIDELTDRALAAMDNEDFRTALSLFDKAISLGGSNDVIELRNGCIGEIVMQYRNSDNYDGAMDYINNFIAREPNNYYLYIKKAELFADKGDLEAAMGYYNKAIELNPKSYEIYLSLGMTLFFEGNDQNRKGNTQAAKGLFQNALQVFDYTSKVLQAGGYSPEAFNNMNDLVQDYINEIQGKLRQMN